MQSDTIEHKVNVFISSISSGRYTIVRKALKKLLLETGMTTVYTFESAPGSSQPMPEAFLQHVDESHLCIFLIDNKDGVTDPVLAEYKRANDLGIKVICLFCDEKKKKPTQLQEEIINTGRGKYYTVHDFSEFTEAAYKSILQDIIDVYKIKQNIPAPSNEESRSLVITSVISSGNYIIDKNIFSRVDNIKNELIKIVFPNSEEEIYTSELDTLSSNFLKVILCKQRFENIDYDKLFEKVIELHQPTHKNLISLRLKAVKHYFSGKIKECIVTLKDALQLASVNQEIANWISNDIAIDLRNMLYISTDLDNSFSVHNEGQKYIDNNSEVVYFPVLDRYEKNVYEKIIKHYYRGYTDSPYITTLGGQADAFIDISNSYFIALIFGSITHLLITRSRIIDALSGLSFEYSDHEIFIELIKMLIVERRDKDLEKLIRIYNQSVDVVNSSDITIILQCIECIPIFHHKVMSEYLLFKYFGYYFSDAQYDELSNKLLSFSDVWVDDIDRIYSIGSYIFEAFNKNLQRINIDRAVEFIFKVLSMDGNRWYDDACSLSSNIDYRSVTPQNQARLLEKSIDILADEEKRKALHRFSTHLIHFRLTATIELELLDAAIREKMSDFYRGEYHLEVFDRDEESSLNNINKYLLSIDIRNREQGINGTIHGYVSDPYGTISNIIRKNNLNLEWDEIRPIIERLNDTLLAPNQSYSDKCKAILLIVFLKNHFGFTVEWNDFLDSLIRNEDKILIGNSLDFFDKDTKRVLYIVYQMMLLAFSRSTINKTINSVISISYMNDIEILRCLSHINSILDEFNFEKADDLVIASIIHLASMMTNHKERDIRYFAVTCLIQLTHSKLTSIVLPQLSTIMDTGTSIIKASIISRVKRIKEGDISIINYIIQKGKVDNNDLVRKMAYKLTDKL